MKKKSILLAALLTVSFAAQAGPYSQENDKQETCYSFAKISMRAAFFKDNGMKRNDSYDAENDEFSAITRFAINYGYNKASDPKDAYMKTYMMCMDNYETSIMKYRHGSPMQDSELQ